MGVEVVSDSIRLNAIETYQAEKAIAAVESVVYDSCLLFDGSCGLLVQTLARLILLIAGLLVDNLCRLLLLLVLVLVLLLLPISVRLLLFC